MYVSLWCDMDQPFTPALGSQGGCSVLPLLYEILYKSCITAMVDATIYLDLYMVSRDIVKLQSTSNMRCGRN